jgi:hypothetical protein
VNFVEYGINALRVQTSANDLLSFGALNGNLIGLILSIAIVLFLILFLIIFFGKYLLRMFGEILK